VRRVFFCPYPNLEKEQQLPGKAAGETRSGNQVIPVAAFIIQY
jgi:hypothetical protein